MSVDVSAGAAASWVSGWRRGRTTPEWKQPMCHTRSGEKPHWRADGGGSGAALFCHADDADIIGCLIDRGFGSPFATGSRMCLRPDEALQAEVSVAKAGVLVAALNEAAKVDGGLTEKIGVMLRHLRTLLGFDADFQVLLYDDLDREPCPRLIERVFAGPIVENLEPRRLADIQAAADAGAGMWQQLRGQVLRRQGKPTVVIYSEDSDASGWFERFRAEQLRPKGWEDMLAALWLLRQDHAVQFLVLRRPEHRPFCDADRELMGLMVCAVAPLIDREMFRRTEVDVAGDLSNRQRDVLHLLLRGLSEKEAARELHRSAETVHNHVRAIYQRLNVSSRGELMARFIDQRVLEKL